MTDSTPALIVHYHEIWLKGCNRSFFVQKLRQAVKNALGGLAVKVRYEDNRLVMVFESDEAANQAAERLRKVPGIANFGVGRQCPPVLDEILETGAAMMRSMAFQTFRVSARRAVKSLPFRSGDIARLLGQRILDEALAAGRSVKVDLTRPEITCSVEVTTNGALIYCAKVQGVGGLPTGTAGKLVCLLSGGFDSAVAAYKVIKRGVRVVFVHFYGAPARPAEDSPPVARELVRVLTAYQGASRLYLVPFSDIQREIVVSAPEAFRLLIYRRFMLRIAERIGFSEHAHGLVTGDSIAQVASQTLQNLEAVGAVARLPLYRPLIGDDKREIIDLARRIGTYDISCEPFTDCCPLYMPKSPRIFSSKAQLDAAEAGLDIVSLVTQGLLAAVKETYVYHEGEVLLKHAVRRSDRRPATVSMGS